MDPVSLAAGEHEFESLGFEDCCDGWSQLEVHLPCDAAASAWRVVEALTSDCMACGGVLDEKCLGASFQPAPAPAPAPESTGGR